MKTWITPELVEMPVSKTADPSKKHPNKAEADGHRTGYTTVLPHEHNS